MTGERSKREMVQGALERLEAVYRVYVDIEEQVRKEIDGIPWKHVPNGEALRLYRYLEYVQANVGRQSVLMMVCAWLEEAMDMLGEDLIPEYTAMVGGKKGSWFKKRLEVWQDHAVQFDSVAEECAFMEAAIVLRNCAVHAGGRIVKYRNPKGLADVVNRLTAKATLGNFNYVTIRDGLLYLGDDILAEAIFASEQIIRHLLRHGNKDVRESGE